METQAFQRPKKKPLAERIAEKEAQKQVQKAKEKVSIDVYRPANWTRKIFTSPVGDWIADCILALNILVPVVTISNSKALRAPNNAQMCVHDPL